MWIICQCYIIVVLKWTVSFSPADSIISWLFYFDKF